MRKRRPFQFSLATVIVAMAGYAALFGMLRSLGVSIAAFIMVTLYFTTVVYSQWAMFGGWHPLGAAFLTGGSLFVLAFIPVFMVSLADLTLVPPAFALVFLVGGLLGIGVAGFTDIWLLLSDILRGAMPKAGGSDTLPVDSLPEEDQANRTKRLAVLAMLASMFFFGMLWGGMTGQEWITRTLLAPGRTWRIPL